MRAIFVYLKKKEKVTILDVLSDVMKKGQECAQVKLLSFLFSLTLESD